MDINLRDAAQDTLPYAEQVALEGGGGQVVANIISSLLSVALIIAAVLVLLYLVWGAIEWISSGGDSGKIEKARNRIMQAIIGLIVLAAVIAVLALIQTLLGVTLIKMTGI